MEPILEIYKKLLEHFGPQGWWPVKNGFEPSEWEIMAGAILTQNTGWRNVEKALESMKNSGITTPEKIIDIGTNELENIIRPSGFYKQKAERLKAISEFILEKNYNFARDELLKVKGIGPETADSIMLYALGKPYFVVDLYTRRVFSRLGMVKGNESYETIGIFFESGLPRDVGLYKEFHALVVELAKRHCKKEPECGLCPLGRKCPKKF